MKRGEELSRHQVLLYKGDFEKLSSINRRRRATQIIRHLVRQHLEAVEAKVAPMERQIEEMENV